MAAQSAFKTRLIKHDDGMWEIRGGGGCLALMGLPFFTVGLFMLLGASGVLGLQFDESNISGRVVLFIMGLIFTSIGGSMMFGRRRLIIDRSQGMVIDTFSIIAPLWRREARLAEIAKIAVTKHVGDHNSITYPITFAGSSLAKPISVTSANDYFEARKMTEDLAKFLSLPIEDATSGAVVVRKVEQLDETVRDRVRHMGEPVPVPSAPAILKSRIEPGSEGLIIDIPASWGLAGWIQLAVPFIFIIFFFEFFIPFGAFAKLPKILTFVLPAIGLVIFGLIALNTARSVRRSTRVIVNRGILRVEQMFYVGRKHNEIPVDQIEELVIVGRPNLLASVVQQTNVQGQPPPPGLTDQPTDPVIPNRESERVMQQALATGRLPDGRPLPGYIQTLARWAPSAGIVARSDNAEVRFGEGLAEEELTYLHARVINAMV
jgi:hypothetical protein